MLPFVFRRILPLKGLWIGILSDLTTKSSLYPSSSLSSEFQSFARSLDIIDFPLSKISKEGLPEDNCFKIVFGFLL